MYKVKISSTNSVYINDDQLDLIRLIIKNTAILDNILNDKQKSAIKILVAKSIVVRSKRGEDVFYSVRKGISIS